MQKPLNKPCKHPTCGTICRRPKKPPAPRKPIQRKPIPKNARTPLKRAKRINPVSKKQAKRNRRYTTLRKQLFADDNICAVSLLENKSQEVIDLFKDCQYYATDYHHDGGRVGKKLFDMNGHKLCRSCHSIIERSPKIAVALGFSKSRLVKIES